PDLKATGTDALSIRGSKPRDDAWAAAIDGARDPDIGTVESQSLGNCAVADEKVAGVDASAVARSQPGDDTGGIAVGYPDVRSIKGESGRIVTRGKSFPDFVPPQERGFPLEHADDTARTSWSLRSLSPGSAIAHKRSPARSDVLGAAVLAIQPRRLGRADDRLPGSAVLACSAVL